MISRSINMEHITSVIETTDFTRMSEDLSSKLDAKKYIEDNVDHPYVDLDGEIAAAISQSKTTPTSTIPNVKSEIGSALEEYCSPNGNIDITDTGYINNLKRLLNSKPTLKVCEKMSLEQPVVTALLNGTEIDYKDDFTSMAKNSATDAVEKLGLPTTAVDCLINELSNLVENIGNITGLPLPDKTDLLGGLDIPCMEEVISDSTNYVLTREATKKAIDSVLDVSLEDGKELIDKTITSDPIMAQEVLEGSIINGDINHLDLKVDAVTGLDILPTTNLSDGVLNNINTSTGNMDLVKFETVDKLIAMGPIPSTEFIKNNDNLNVIAINHLSNVRSTDGHEIVYKKTNIDLATQSVLSNLKWS